MDMHLRGNECIHDNNGTCGHEKEVQGGMGTRYWSRNRSENTFMP